MVTAATTPAATGPTIPLNALKVFENVPTRELISPNTLPTPPKSAKAFLSSFN